MNAPDVKALFQSYIDEPDGTFITSANINTYLDAGYNEFRLRVSEYNSDFYARQVVISTNGTDSYDLSSTSGNPVTLIGPAPSVGTANAMIRLNSVRISNATGTERGAIYKAVSGIRGLQANYQSWAMIGTVLMFSESVTETFQLSYVAVADINWDAAGQYIDSLGPYHDLIALYAYKQYAIRDNAINQPLQAQLAIREKDFRDYLSSPNHETNQYVNQDWSSYDNV
tara:strand:+ start:500 stop:1180 length:681 start_codon:yes stop_codon:yes gene_type:complete